MNAKSMARPIQVRQLTTLAVVAVTSGAVIAAAVAMAPARPIAPRARLVTVTGPAAHGKAAASQAAPQAGAVSALAPAPAVTTRFGILAEPAFPLVLTAVDRRSCPAAATACVDLAHHLTWLQSAGRITFGPVRMEPGPPGTVHATPRGTFHVAWKAGPDYISNIYHDPMPWATFFAVGGIAFHGGSLVQWSHGCVHLTISDARYYNTHLPIGAEVVVF